MLKRFFHSAYTKAALTMLVSGALLLIVNRWLKSTNFSEFFSTVNDTLSPVYIGALIAFVLCPIYNFLVRNFYALLKPKGRPRRRLRRTYYNVEVPEPKPKKNPAQRALTYSRVIATLICLAIIIVVIGLIARFILPQVIGSVINLMNTLPKRMAKFAAWATVKFAKYPAVVKMIQNVASSDTTEMINWVQALLQQHEIKDVAAAVSSSLISMIRAFINVFVGILLSVYLLNYKEHLLAIGRKIIAATCSERKAKGVYQFCSIINETFIGYIVGRIIDAVIIGFLTYFSMSLLNMPMAVLISVIVGVTNVIPFFGPFLGAIPSLILLLLEDPIQAFYFLILILVIQQLDGNVIGPKVVGSAIGISSFWILISVLIGGGLFGFVGMALGVPVFAVIYRYIDIGTSGRLSRKSRKVHTQDYFDYSKYGIDKNELQTREESETDE